MEPSIEITYDPTIKVHGITEELFKQQPEGKFVLKPFTIISKKVYKNFTDRSHAFNYLLKFLKKKSKEDNNVILRVFSEPGKTGKWFFISLFFSSFLLNPSPLLKLLVKTIPPIKYAKQVEDSIDEILSDELKEKFNPINYINGFVIILLFISISLILPEVFPQVKEFKNSFSFAYSVVYLVFGVIFGVSAYIMIKVLFDGGINLLERDTNFKSLLILKKILHAIKQSTKLIDKKTVMVVNFDIYSHSDSTTAINFIKYLLNICDCHEQISIILNVQNMDFIDDISAELTASKLAKTSFFIERIEKKNGIEVLENSEFKDENLPLKYEYYEMEKKWNFEQEELQRKNKQLERENKEQLARIIQSAKLESISITTSGLAHEIRNPLSIVQLVIENLRIEKNLNKETLMEDLDTIQKQISRVFKLTETFQKYSSKRNLTKKSIDRQITNSLSFFEQRLISNKIEVNYDKPEERIGAIEFSEELSIVIENLISNSIDALSENKDGIIKIRMLLEDTKLVLLFSDNGHGVSDEDKDKIFTPLFTTKGPGKGTGLGLWLCYTIVKENLNGEIRIVDSEPNLNTTFRISLPIGGD